MKFDAVELNVSINAEKSLTWSELKIICMHTYLHACRWFKHRKILLDSINTYPNWHFYLPVLSVDGRRHNRPAVGTLELAVIWVLKGRVCDRPFWGWYVAVVTYNTEICSTLITYNRRFTMIYTGIYTGSSIPRHGRSTTDADVEWVSQIFNVWEKSRDASRVFCDLSQVDCVHHCFIWVKGYIELTLSFPILPYYQRG